MKKSKIFILTSLCLISFVSASAKKTIGNLKFNSEQGRTSNLQTFETQKEASSFQFGAKEQALMKFVNNTSTDSLKHFVDFNFFNFQDTNCNINVCPPPSYCSNDTTCNCAKGKANFTIQPAHPANAPCQYNQKKHLLAFLMESMTNCGLGYAYVGKFIHAVFKFAFMLLCLFLIYNDTKDNPSPIIASRCVIIPLVIFIYIVDFFLFFNNFVTDSNGIPLEHWSK